MSAEVCWMLDDVHQKSICVKCISQPGLKTERWMMYSVHHRDRAMPRRTKAKEHRAEGRKKVGGRERDAQKESCILASHCRLGIVHPEISEMQCVAIFRAAAGEAVVLYICVALPIHRIRACFVCTLQLCPRVYSKLLTSCHAHVCVIKV